MDSRKLVYRETGRIAFGVAICSAVMLAVYALLGRFDRTVVLGGVIGTVMAVLNFFFMAMNATMAADKALKQDVKGGKSLVQVSYMVRLAVIFLILFACVKSGLCNAFASVLPLVFVRPIITVAEFFRKSGEEKV